MQVQVLAFLQFPEGVGIGDIKLYEFVQFSDLVIFELVSHFIKLAIQHAIEGLDLAHVYQLPWLVLLPLCELVLRSVILLLVF